mmetsp:Transcript_27285/g.41245  ORF Transcript_27285/g.41245 Transcript_27285/m.41245 type:complete len:328 (+) Transcript_27285:23-1006(+)
MEEQDPNGIAGDGWDDGLDLDLDLESYMEEDALLDAIQNAPAIGPTTDDFDLDDWGEAVILSGPSGPQDEPHSTAVNKDSATSCGGSGGVASATSAFPGRGHSQRSNAAAAAVASPASASAASSSSAAATAASSNHGGAQSAGSIELQATGGRRHAQRPQGGGGGKGDGKGQGKGQADQKNAKKRPFPWKAVGLLTAGVFSAIYFGLGLLEGEPPRAEIPETFLASQPEIQLPVNRKTGEAPGASSAAEGDHIGQRRGSVDVDRSASASVFNATATEWDGELANESASNPDPYYSGDGAKGAPLRDRKGRSRGKAENDLAAVANAIR